MTVETRAPGRSGAAEQSADYPSLGAANYGVVLLFLAYVLSFLDRNILSLLVGPIREQFGITDFQYSLLAGRRLRARLQPSPAFPWDGSPTTTRGG